MIKSLEGGRGIAALIVALYHFQIGGRHIPVLANGYLFVDLFFVLSGFVICAAYGSRLHDRRELRGFVIRRIGRLLPLLVFSTVAFVLAVNLIAFAKKFAIAHGYANALNNPQAVEFLIPGAGEILATLTMTHSLGLFDRLILNTPSWSISTEFYTYLLFAATCLLFGGAARRRIFLLLSLFGAAIAVWASIQLHHCLHEGGCLSVTWDFGFARSIYSFFLGALAFHASTAPGADFKRLQWPALALLAAMLAGVARLPWLAFAFPLAFAVLILSVAHDEGALAKFLQRPVIQMLGQRSYSIYLMHMPLVLFFENAARRVDGVVAGTAVMLAYISTLVWISGWTYRRVEDPFRAAFNRLAAGERTGSASVLLTPNRRMD